MTAAGIFSRTSNGKFSPISHFGTSTSHKCHGLCEGSAYVHSSVRLYLLVLTRLYTYIFSMSIVFCDSSQYINRNKSNCGGEGSCSTLVRGLQNLGKLSERKVIKGFLSYFLCLTKSMEKFQRGFNWIARSCYLCALIRGLQNLEISCEGERVVTFCIVQKVTKKHAGLRPATSIQIAGRYVFEAKVTGFHQVTGNAEICNFSSIAGNDLNRCDAPALQRKELSEQQKNGCILCRQ